MEIKVDFSPEQVNQAVAQTIINSSLGQQLTKVIEEKARELGSSWNNNDPLRKAIDAEIARVLRELLLTEPYQSILRQKIEAVLTDELLTKISSAAVGALIDKI